MPRTLSRRWAAPFAAAVLGATLAAPACAGAIPLDTFLQFAFTDAGTGATGCDPADPAGPICIPSSGTPTVFLDAPAWIFDAPASGALLTVVDAFASGDRFEIFDFGVLVGFTSLIPRGAFSDCGDDPVNCLADAVMSKGFFVLGPGSHSLTLTPLESPSGLGSAYLHVAAAVPAPASALLAALGLAALGVPRRARTTLQTKEAA